MTTLSNIDLHVFQNHFVPAARNFFMYAGIYYIIFFVVFKSFFAKRKIQSKDFRKMELLEDALNSLMTFFIFGMLSLLYASPTMMEHTKLYMNFEEHSTLWNVLSLPFLLLFYDAYFYWTHRIMHHRWFFSLVHSTHHKTKNTSPFTSYSFHPIEAVIQYIWIIPMVYLVPIQGEIFFLFGLIVMIINIIGHGGINIHSQWWIKNRVGRWFNTGIYHNRHHEFGKGNYSIFLTFWDRIMGTMVHDHSKKDEPSQKEKS